MFLSFKNLASTLAAKATGTMKVCIAEKPSVAKEIAFILGAKSRHDGYFEGNGYQVTWTFGHLCELKAPDDYSDDWKKWQMHTLPMLPPKFETKVKKDKGVKKQFNTVKKLFKKAEVVINCGDAGQEGELIQRWVINEAGYKGKVLRLWISSLTSEAIREGFQNLKNASNYDNLYYAGFSRAIGDWLLGMNATRLYTLKYGGYKQVLSVGRVQTPTLAMLVARHYEITNFKPEPYWELHTAYRETNFQYIKGKLQKKEDGENLLQQVKDQPFTITKVEKKKGKEYAPKLFDLTSLQIHCNKRFSYSADNTLKIVQKLYEQKVVTYPRVDTTYLPNDVYPKIPGILGKMQQYSQYTQTLLGAKIRKSPKVFNDKKVTDHHAIIPTGMEKNLVGAEWNVYDAIARRFIGVFYPDCEVAKTVVLGESAAVVFKTNGKVILKEGWREVVFPNKGKKTAVTSDKEEKSEKEKENEEKVLPDFKEGETGPHAPKLLEKMTQPPKYFTEATLLRAMETAGKQVDDDELRDLMKENGIGRPSTRANIIETLFRRKYTVRNRKQILPTETGISLIDIIKNDLVKSPELTGKWEKQLREIESGNYSAATFISEMKSMVSKVVEEVKQDRTSARFVSSTPQTPYKKGGNKGGEKFGAKATRSAKEKKKVAANTPLTQQSCPKCYKGKLIKGNSAYGCTRYTEGCTFRLPFEFMGKKISENQLARLMAKGSTVNLKGFKESGQTKEGLLRFDKDYALRFEAKKGKAAPQKTAQIPDVLTCPKCKKGKVLKGNSAYGCSRYTAGCDWRFDFSEVFAKAKGKTMTKGLVWDILRGR
ncbi:MAG: DNA topoisomerase-3 [Saprospiraceae bacterium]